MSKYLTIAKQGAKEYDRNPTSENADAMVEATWQFYCLEADRELWHSLTPPPPEEE